MVEDSFDESDQDSVKNVPWSLIFSINRKMRSQKNTVILAVQSDVHIIALVFILKALPTSDHNVRNHM